VYHRAGPKIHRCDGANVSSRRFRPHRPQCCITIPLPVASPFRRPCDWCDRLLLFLGIRFPEFFGGIAGVCFAHHLLGANLSSFPVRCVITLPDRNGSIIAFVAEFITAFFLMEVVLLASSHSRLARYTPLFVALVTVFYHMLSMSISGYSVNPARSFSSALFAHIWQVIWIYFIAPGFGMLAAATLYRKVAGAGRVYCAKVFHDFQSNCPFNCRIAELYDRAQPVNQWCPETASPAPHSAPGKG
jgi:hypothetical protein